VAKVHPGAEPKIFVNVDNVHLDALLKGGGYQETGLSRMKDNFVLYVAFFAWNRESTLQQDPQTVRSRPMHLRSTSTHLALRLLAQNRR
jgi:hypothetical protein